MRVLYIDDNRINLKVIEAMLGIRSAQALSAPNGEVGLAMLDAEDVDAVLVDLRMPEMDGFEVLRRIRGRGDAKASLPVCIVTADPDSNLGAQARRAGADEFLTKPVMMADLFAFLDAVEAQDPRPAVRACP